MRKKVIAVFGGSFNPPINSHLILAKQILEKCNLIEKLIFVPVSTRYQKDNLVSDEHRFNMLNLMCKKEDKLEVSDIELKYHRQLYTIETLNLIKQKYNKYEIWFVMGTDNLKEIECWREYKRLLNNYKIVVLRRNDDDIKKIIESKDILREHKNSIIEIEGIDIIDLSSTMIRERIKNRENVEEYIQKDVLNYIREKKLYL